jgi:hypothetical protein
LTDSSGEPPTQVGLVDEEVVELGSVERNDRDSLQVAGQQLVVAFDVDLLEGMADAVQYRAGVVAQVAARAAVEHEGHEKPRSPLA